MGSYYISVVFALPFSLFHIRIIEWHNANHSQFTSAIAAHCVLFFCWFFFHIYKRTIKRGPDDEGRFSPRGILGPLVLMQRYQPAGVLCFNTGALRVKTITHTGGCPGKDVFKIQNVSVEGKKTNFLQGQPTRFKIFKYFLI